MDNADLRNSGNGLVGHVLSVIIILVMFAPWLYDSLFVHPVFYQNYDPEIQYFMNSLMAFKGQTYYFVDHPSYFIRTSYIHRYLTLGNWNETGPSRS